MNLRWKELRNQVYFARQDNFAYYLYREFLSGEYFDVREIPEESLINLGILLTDYCEYILTQKKPRFFSEEQLRIIRDLNTEAMSDSECVLSAQIIAVAFLSKELLCNLTSFKKEVLPYFDLKLWPYYIVESYTQFDEYTISQKKVILIMCQIFLKNFYEIQEILGKNNIKYPPMIRELELNEEIPNNSIKLFEEVGMIYDDLSTSTDIDETTMAIVYDTAREFL